MFLDKEKNNSEKNSVPKTLELWETLKRKNTVKWSMHDEGNGSSV